MLPQAQAEVLNLTASGQVRAETAVCECCGPPFANVGCICFVSKPISAGEAAECPPCTINGASLLQTRAFATLNQGAGSITFSASGSGGGHSAGCQGSVTGKAFAGILFSFDVVNRPVEMKLTPTVNNRRATYVCFGRGTSFSSCHSGTNSYEFSVRPISIRLNPGHHSYVLYLQGSTASVEFDDFQFDASFSVDFAELGACCVPNQGCDLLGPGQCQQAGGDFQGPGTICAGGGGQCDSDGDDLLDNVENQITGTDPLNPDTDGDGLLDSEEVDPSVAGAGFHLTDASGNEVVVNRDDVFGPYSEQSSNSTDPASGRPSVPYTAFVRRPNPLKKDMYIEIDWEDCRLGNCPDYTLCVPGTTICFGLRDDNYHGPLILALDRVITAFKLAPVQNIDHRGINHGDGVNLHILLDENARHEPNCDRIPIAQRVHRFGTPSQRSRPDVMKAKEAVFRYVWGGHSSRRDYPGDFQPSPVTGICPTPGLQNGALVMGGIYRQAPDYDFTPFGQARVGGQDIILSLSPFWVCPDAMAPCLEVFPQQVRDQNGTLVCIDRPMNFYVNTLPNFSGPVQVQSRALMHLLGHALGLAQESEVLNNPLAVAPTSGILFPDSYANWQGLQYTPGGIGGALPDEAYPVPVGCPVPLVQPQDSDAQPGFSLTGDDDRDGTSNVEDNCPGLFNPGFPQPDLDGDGVGDACDEDMDGDTIQNAADAHPMDTDNDGVDNASDADADQDGVCNSGGPLPDGAPGAPPGGCQPGPDGRDNCLLAANPDQIDFDTDGLGRACDEDDDNDSFIDVFEQILGADPLHPASVPEVAGFNCGDGVDNDNDGKVDGADEGCTDTDGDTVPDFIDNCPGAHNVGARDYDADGSGDACDSDDDNDGIADEADACPFSPLGASADSNGCALVQVDFDLDGICDPGLSSSHCAGSDNCPLTINLGQEDADGDRIGDLCDNCPATPNTEQFDRDSDSVGDACDPCTDFDGDGFGEPGYPADTCPLDNCPRTANADQADTDGDGFGGACEECPEDPDKIEAGLCGCGVADTDSDNDATANCHDTCPADPSRAHGGPCACAMWHSGLPPLDDGVETFVVYDDGNGPALYAGGFFTMAGGVPANRIAKWDGANWSPLGTGLDDEVTALTVYDGKLIVGGWFNNAGGNPANFIAQWDGHNWSPLGGGMDDPVTALTIYQGSLIAGGWFTKADGQTANRIAQWSGNGWSPLAGGMDDDVNALAVHQDALVAGGRFKTAGGAPAVGIAQWNGAAWLPLGGGVGGSFPFVNALTVQDGTLVAAGDFGTADGLPAEAIAQWNGAAWSALGGGINGTVLALTIHEGRLIAGGFFGSADDFPTENIAQWTGLRWAPLDGGTDNDVYALISYGGALIAGGFFSSAGDQPSENWARWAPLGSFSPADFDRDCSVDDTDYGLFLSCAAGPALPYFSGCGLVPDGNGRIAADFDADGDVDAADFGAFQRCYGGAGVSPGPACAN